MLKSVEIAIFLLVSIEFYWRATINATSNKITSKLSERLRDWIVCQVDNESFKQQRKQTCSFCSCHWQTLSWLVRHVWDGDISDEGGGFVCL